MFGMLPTLNRAVVPPSDRLRKADAHDRARNAMPIRLPPGSTAPCPPDRAHGPSATAP